jgi:hypothetical protein
MFTMQTSVVSLDAQFHYGKGHNLLHLPGWRLSRDLEKLLHAVGDPFEPLKPPLPPLTICGLTMMVVVVLIDFASSDL